MMRLFKRKTEVREIPELTSQNVNHVLQTLYVKKVVPMEFLHIYHQFDTPPIDPAEWGSNPMILFLGQHSVGKTTMINHLIGKKYPGSQIGPEPTTDCFTAVYHSKKPYETQGTTLAEKNGMPFKSLMRFGQSFLNRFRGASLPATMLEMLTFIDTPGILSGQKQTSYQGYDLSQVVHALACKVDMIVLLFDTSKPDISDEYKEVLHNLRGNEEKIKIVLNKADIVTPDELIRVRDVLMWSLSKILSTVEVPRVHIGSFWKNCKKEKDIFDQFAEDCQDLVMEIVLLPSLIPLRRLNDVIKRAKSVKNHALIMHEILSNVCSTYECHNARVKAQLSEVKIEQLFLDIKKKYCLTDSDLPDPAVFREKAAKSNIEAWDKIDPKYAAKLDEFLNEDVRDILAVLPANREIPTALKSHFTHLMTYISKTTNTDDIKTPRSNPSPVKK
ncbi:hypothetical protein L596_024766 [Steinernema carpocapsae]|uniref:Dynamin-type G domain-containing protein n=1 Tax=Steinernema carpocapsae TaxID=34508 RepID=A0A4U5M5P6_STECR|nr:hypothetical protein L596_024766 [Steinernema carpocapsae]